MLMFLSHADPHLPTRLPCHDQADMEVVRAIIDFAQVTEDDVRIQVERGSWLDPESTSRWWYPVVHTSCVAKGRTNVERNMETCMRICRTVSCYVPRAVCSSAGPV